MTREVKALNLSMQGELLRRLESPAKGNKRAGCPPFGSGLKSANSFSLLLCHDAITVICLVLVGREVGRVLALFS